MICRFVGGCVDGQRFDVGNADSLVTMHAGMGTNWQVDCYKRCQVRLGAAVEFVYVVEEMADESLALQKLLGAL